MIEFPWKVHGLTKGPPHDFLVHIEHRHLIQVYEDALASVDTTLAKLPKPAHSGTPEFSEWVHLGHTKRSYEEMIAWLKRLEP